MKVPHPSLLKNAELAGPVEKSKKPLGFSGRND
jgi:hypothetical protein